MTVTALVLPSLGAPFTAALPKDDPAASLRVLVGGYIEGVYGVTRYEEHVTLYCNDEGKLRNLPVNAVATLLWRHLNQGTVIRDELVGTVVVLGGDGPCEVGVPESVVRIAETLYQALTEVPLPLTP